jgi:hypothetical protein
MLRVLESLGERSAGFGIRLGESRYVDQAFRTARNWVILRYASQSGAETSATDDMLMISGGYRPNEESEGSRDME